MNMKEKYTLEEGGYAENEVKMKTVIEFMIPPETPTLPHTYSYFDGCAE